MDRSVLSGLVKAGTLSPQQLAKAQRAQRELGGCVESHLVSHGQVDEDALATFYEQFFQLPRMADGDLEQISPAVLAQIPYDLASEYGVVPFDLDAEGTLYLAMAHPGTIGPEELGFFTSRPVVLAVASESEVARALCRYYGIVTRRTQGPPPADLVEAPEPNGSSGRDTPAEPLSLPDPGTPRRTQLFISTGGPPQLGPEPLAADTPSPVEEMSVEHAPPALEALGEVQSQEVFVDGSLPSEGPSPMLLLLDTVDALRSAVDRDTIALVTLEFFAHFFRRSVFFAVKKGALRCWDTRGFEDSAALSALAIPLDVPSLLRDVVLFGGSYRGPLAASAINRLVASALGTPSSEILLVPVRVLDRAIALLLAADSVSTILPVDVSDRLSQEIGAAYERILSQKRQV